MAERLLVSQADHHFPFIHKTFLFAAHMIRLCNYNIVLVGIGSPLLLLCCEKHRDNPKQQPRTECSR